MSKQAQPGDAVKDEIVTWPMEDKERAGAIEDPKAMDVLSDPLNVPEPTFDPPKSDATHSEDDYIIESLESLGDPESSFQQPECREPLDRPQSLKGSYTDAERCVESAQKPLVTPKEEIVNKEKPVEPISATVRSNIDNLPSDCICKRLSSGFVDVSTSNTDSSIYKYVETVYNDDGFLPLQMLGSREDLANSAWWLNRVDQISLALNDRFPWLSIVTERICNNLLFCGRFQTPIHIPPMLLIGQHGIGKTSYLNYLAELLKIRVKFVDVSGVSAGWVLTGVNASWNRGKQGVIIETLLDFHTCIDDSQPIGNPIIVLDEIDKESSDSRYPLNTVLLPILEKSTAKRFTDEFINGMSWDISYMSFFATANSLQGISEPLLSRLQVMQIAPPTEAQKFNAVLRMVDEYHEKIRDEMQVDNFATFSFRLEDDEIAREIAKMESLRDIAWRLDDAVRRVVARDPLAEVFILKPGDFDLAPQKRSFTFMGIGR